MKHLIVIMVSLLWGSFAGAGSIPPNGLSTLPRADVIILGEVHDNAEQHANQARAVAAIHPTALVFEMMTPDQVARITSENRHDKTALEQALGWRKSGWPDFAMYFPILQAAPHAEILAGDRARGEVRRSVSEGAAAVFGAFSPLFGLTTPLPTDEQRARESLQREAHCNALPEHLLPGMVEAQRLRDATLAKATLAAVETTGGPVVIITGNGHARKDWGVPRVLLNVSPELKVLSVGQIEGEITGTPPFDLYLTTSVAQRNDPCAVFKKN